MLNDLIGRPEDVQPDPPAAAPVEGRVSPVEAVWLVLATHLRGLEEAGVVDERSASRIASAIETLQGQASVESSFRRLEQHLEERIDSALPDELRGAATLGLAREEWSGTALRVVVRSSCLAVANDIVDMQRAMLAMAELHAVTLMQGFHTGQPMQPVTFGHLLGGAVAPVGTGLARLLDAIDGLNRSPLGAGSMSGEIVGAERAETARWLGFRATIPNTYDAVANVEDVVDVIEAVGSAVAPVARLMDELAVMVRTDPSSLVFDDAWMRSPDHHLPGFSAVERLTALAQDLRSIVSLSHSMVSRLRQVPFGPLGAASDWIARDLSALLDRSAEHVNQVGELFRSALTVNRAYLANRAGRGYTTANDLAAFLMTEEQLPPSVARNIAGLTIRRLKEENLEISTIAPDHVDMAAMMVIGRELKVEMETLGRWFAPRRFLERRLVEGSPAPAKTREWIEQERGSDQQAAERVAARRMHIRDAEADMRKWVSDRAAEDDD